MMATLVFCGLIEKQERINLIFKILVFGPVDTWLKVNVLRRSDRVSTKAILGGIATWNLILCNIEIYQEHSS